MLLTPWLLAALAATVAVAVLDIGPSVGSGTWALLVGAGLAISSTLLATILFLAQTAPARSRFIARRHG